MSAKGEGGWTLASTKTLEELKEAARRQRDEATQKLKKLRAKERHMKLVETRRNCFLVGKYMLENAPTDFKTILESLRELNAKNVKEASQLVNSASKPSTESN